MRSAFSLRRLAFAMVAALGLLGCAAVRHDWVEPTSGPTAQLAVAGVPDGTVGLHLYDDYRTCSGRRLVASPNNDNRILPRPVRVVAGQPLAFTVWAVKRGNLGCNQTGTFTPQANQRYVAQMIVSEADRSCRLVVRTENGRPVAVRPRVIGNQLTVTEQSSFCSAD